MAAVMRSGITEVGVTELVAVTEHVHACCRITLGLGLEDQESMGWTARRILDEPVSDDARPVLDEAVVAFSDGGARRYWEVLARNRWYLKATWEKHLIVLGAGELTTDEKLIVAFAVSVQAGSASWRDHYAQALDEAGLSLSDLLEIIGVVDHYNSFNKITDAMQVPSDITPPR